MFGFLLGTARKDLEAAKIINMYLVSYHRTYTSMGLEFLLRTIKGNELVSNYKEGTESRSFFIGRELEDFHFQIVTLPGAAPAVSIIGMVAYHGFSAFSDLPTGKTLVSCKRTRLTTPTKQADILAKALCWKFGATRMP